MRSLSHILKAAGKTMQVQSPYILAGVSVVGVLGTVALTARAAFRVGKDVNAGHYEPLMEGMEPEVYDAKGLIKAYWPEFVPAASLGLATVTCIVGGAVISHKRAAALTAAYSITQAAFTEYKDKVVEQIGINQEQKVRDAVAQDKVDRDPVGSREVVIVGTGDVLCYETITGRYFRSNMESLRKAQNDVNHEIFNDMYASMNFFFDKIGLPATQIGEEIGWNTSEMLELQFTSVLSDNNEPAIAIGYTSLPITNYYKCN